MSANPTRRTALQFGALSLPAIFQLRAAEETTTNTTVIFVTLGGGPSQFETYDPKPDAPSEYRGTFDAIDTNVEGVRICELFPKQARIMDKLAIIRSVHHRQASHIAEHIVETGYDLLNSRNSLRGEMPSVGSIVSALRGSPPSGIPAFVVLPDRRAYGGPHWLGGQHRHFPVNEDPNDAGFSVKNLIANLNDSRLEDRQSLLGDLDSAEREIEAKSVDAFTRQAFELLTGPKARQAFDISAEPDSMRDRYGRNVLGQRMLLARRLAEADVPFVTVRMGGWDDHKDLVKRITPRAAEYDQALTALITDLHERTMNRKVLVVAMGEFGRTPRINTTGGRDHWPAVNNVLIAGGEYRMGQVIGASDRIGAAVTEAP